MSLATMLNDSATLYQRTEEQSATTGFITRDYAAGATFRCRVQALSAFESTAHNQEVGSTLYRVFMVPGACDAEVGDRILWGTLMMEITSQQRDDSGQGPYRSFTVAHKTSGIIR